MTQLVIAWLRLVIVITLVFLGVYGADQSNLAQNAIIDSVIPAGSVVDDDAIIAGEEVVVDGDVNGDLLVLAINATINGNVTGSVITTAQTVTVNGKIDGTLYTFGRELTLAEGSTVGRNVYFIGLRLETAQDSVIGRDLVGVSLRARLGGAIGRDLKAVIGLFELLGQFTSGGNDAAAPSGNSALPASDSANGAWASTWNLFRQVALKSIGGAAYQPFWPLVIDRADAAQNSMPKQGGFQLWARIAIEEFVLLILTGLLFVWRYSPRLEEWSDKAKAAPLAASGYGFVGIIVAINVAILAVLAFGLIVTIGFVLGFASLWKLAFIFWALALSMLGLAATLAFLFVFYGSKVIVAYMLSRWIAGLISEKALKYRYLLMFFGLLIYVLLQSLPYVGGTLNFIVIIIGLGAVWLVRRDERQAALLAKQVASEPQVAA